MSKFATFFKFRELKDPYDDVMGVRGVKRMVAIGFILGFLAINILSYLAFKPVDHFILPTGLTTTRLVVVTFLLTMFYYKFDAEKLQEIDERYNLNYIYIPEKHEKHLKKKY